MGFSTETHRAASVPMAVSVQCLYSVAVSMQCLSLCYCTPVVVACAVAQGKLAWHHVMVQAASCVLSMACKPASVKPVCGATQTRQP